MSEEFVTFTEQQVTVIVEHVRVIEKVLKSQHGLTTTEYCILRAISVSGAEVVGIDFASFLLLKKNAVTTALTILETKKLIKKKTNTEDKRKMSICTTKAGVEITEAATVSIFNSLKNSFWRDFSDKEIKNAVAAGPLVLKKVRSASNDVTNFYEPTDALISSEFIVALKIVTQTWTKEIKKMSDLSLSEFRILGLISKSPEPVRASDLARRLWLDPSVVSNYKTKLLEKGLIVETSYQGDKRNLIINCTEKGEQITAMLTSRLARTTAEMYSLLGEEEAQYLNEWHMRMYRDMNAYSDLRGSISNNQ